MIASYKTCEAWQVWLTWYQSEGISLANGPQEAITAVILLVCMRSVLTFQFLVLIIYLLFYSLQLLFLSKLYLLFHFYSLQFMTDNLIFILYIYIIVYLL